MLVVHLIHKIIETIAVIIHVMIMESVNRFVRTNAHALTLNLMLHKINILLLHQFQLSFIYFPLFSVFASKRLGDKIVDNFWMKDPTAKIT